MNVPLTTNTQATLLLTAPLIAGRSADSPELLTLSEYNRLARVLRENLKQPGELVAGQTAQALEMCAAVFGRDRLEALLGRGFLLSQAVERWSSRAIWVTSRDDSTYPRRLLDRLKDDASPILYGCGDPALLNTGGFAVVGSRHVDEELIAYTENVGRLAAEAGCNLISGAARGIDRAAMNGALRGGGRVLGVMADTLERGALAPDNREPLTDRNLLLISPYDPAAGFNVGLAMQRNKVIYALADAALVVTSDFEKGGTWAGATEQLRRYQFVPVFVRGGTGAGKGNAALLQRGGCQWPDPRNPAQFREAISKAEAARVAQPRQETFALTFGEQVAAYNATKGPRSGGK